MEEWINEIKQRAATGKPLISAGRSTKWNKISFDDLVFVPAQLATRPIDYYKEDIATETIIGKNCEKPLRLKIPILIPAMSFGAVSKEVKIALAKASSILGTATNTGEGGMLPEERENAKLLIAQYSTGRFGVDENYIKKADAIEIKIGQGAKVGQGGLLPKEKVTEEIAKVRKIPYPPKEDIHSPAAHPDIKTVEDLKKKVEWLRELNKGPIIIKIGAGQVEEDIKFAVKAGPDAIAVDGMGAATGAAPRVMLDEVGIPTLSALVRARKTLDKLKAKQELIISGGLSKGADVAKALALGADAACMATSLLIAMGCIYCKLCNLGKCPVGIATQDEELRKKLDPKAVEHVVNFVKACVEEMKMIAAACGKKNVHSLTRENLRSLDLTVEKITGIHLV
jgi:glutamate synthase domain-containing protein 2